MVRHIGNVLHPRVAEAFIDLAHSEPCLRALV